MDFNEIYKDVQEWRDITEKLIEKWNELLKMQETVQNEKNSYLRHGISEEEYNNLRKSLEQDIKRLSEKISC